MKFVVKLVALFFIAFPLSASANVLKFNLGAEPESLDPARMSGVPEHAIALGLHDTLTNSDPKTLKPVPGIALSSKVENSGKRYIFTLRRDAKWSNG